MLWRFKELWADNRKYFFIGCILMLSGVIIGFVEADKVDAIAKEMISKIKELVERIGTKDNSVAAFRVIFFNNVLSSVLMMILGTVFAIFPIYGMVTNGILLGYILQKAESAGQNALQLFAVGILPHGIIELPVVIFAAGIGIRYGVLMVRTLISAWNEKERMKIKGAWQKSIRQFPIAVVTVILLLGVAAFVESVITPALIQKTVGNQTQIISDK